MHVRQTVTADASGFAPRRIRLAAYLVPLCVLPSALWRLSVIVTGPLCDPVGGAVDPRLFEIDTGEAVYLVALSVLSMTAALLTIGLVRPWGEVVPQWIPWLGGRRIPVLAAVIPAAVGAGLIVAVVAYGAANAVFHFVPEPTTGCLFPRGGPEVVLLKLAYAPLLAWAPLLIAVTVSYYRRRTRGAGTDDAGGSPQTGRPDRRDPSTPVARDRRDTVICGAGLWSTGAAVVGLMWAMTGRGFPFGVNDARAREAGSLFVGAEPRTAGLVVAVLGLLGVGMAVVASRRRGVRSVTTAAWAFAIALLLLVPDVRMIQNFAYLFFGYFGKIDAATLWMLAAIAGGLLWAGVGMANAMATRPLRASTRPASVAVTGSAPRVAPTWGRAVTIVAAVLALPYPAVRISWALGIPLGVPDSYVDVADLMLRVGEAALGLLAIGGAVLTLGLIRPWGEVFPRWISGLGGRPVPVWVAVVPGAWAAILISAAGLRLAIWTVLDSDWSQWGTGGPGLFFLPWGLTVGAATYAYWIRRTAAHDGPRAAPPEPAVTVGSAPPSAPRSPAAGRTGRRRP
jgi:hypothetical protein